MLDFQTQRTSLLTRAGGKCNGYALADHTKTSLPVNPEALLSPGASGFHRPASPSNPSVFWGPVVTVPEQ